MSNTAKKRKIGSRACDGCKIRKVRCSEVPPCERCVDAGIACTFHKLQATRGPRSLRAKTMEQIQVAQERQRELAAVHAKTSGPGGHGEDHDHDCQHGMPHSRPYVMHDTSSTGWPRQAQAQAHIQPPPRPQTQHRTRLDAMILRLGIYRLRLFPVWPIVAVEEVIAALQRDGQDTDTHYALANAVGAATMAQLKLGGGIHDHVRGGVDINDAVTGAMMEAECQRARHHLHLASPDTGYSNMNMLRTSFFLHIYHENQVPGGTKSLLYLREAITMAQIMGLHRPATYEYLPVVEQRMRRRILWLLFVTERGVAMLHQLPTAITCGHTLPSLHGSAGEDEAHILPAFKKLVSLFCIFDQSGAFELVQNGGDDPNMGGEKCNGPGVFDALRRRLQEVPLDMEMGSSDVQKADIWVTRQWMQVLLWRATHHRQCQCQCQCHCHCHCHRRCRGRSSSAALSGSTSSWGDLDMLTTTISSSSTSTLTCASTAASLSRPIQIAEEFLELVSRLPETALEAHGPAIEFKIYDIASAVTDAIADRFRQHQLQAQAMDALQPAGILLRLQKMLASCRGGNGNKSLLTSLCARIAQVEARPVTLGPHGLASAGGNRVQETDGEETEREWDGMGDDDGDDDNDERRQYGEVSGLLSSGSSPWFSLAAAAELEQYSTQTQTQTQTQLRHGAGCPSRFQPSPGQQPSIPEPLSPLSQDVNALVNSLSWQPLELLGQLGNWDAWPADGNHEMTSGAMESSAVGTEGWSPGLLTGQR